MTLDLDLKNLTLLNVKNKHNHNFNIHIFSDLEYYTSSDCYVEEAGIEEIFFMDS